MTAENRLQQRQLRQQTANPRRVQLIASGEFSLQEIDKLAGGAARTAIVSRGPLEGSLL
jgi:hypothetical protein